MDILFEQVNFWDEALLELGQLHVERAGGHRGGCAAKNFRIPGRHTAHLESPTDDVEVRNDPHSGEHARRQVPPPEVTSPFPLHSTRTHAMSSEASALNALDTWPFDPKNLDSTAVAQGSTSCRSRPEVSNGSSNPPHFISEHHSNHLKHDWSKDIKYQSFHTHPSSNSPRHPRRTTHLADDSSGYESTAVGNGTMSWQQASEASPSMQSLSNGLNSLNKGFPLSVQAIKKMTDVHEIHAHLRHVSHLRVSLSLSQSYGFLH